MTKQPDFSVQRQALRAGETLSLEGIVCVHRKADASRATLRSTIWDMGRIASLGTVAGLDLFRDIVTASVSLPEVFPPMLVNAEANGLRFQEMHVDGGVMAPVLTLPEAYQLRNATMGDKGDVQLYILINNKVEPEFQLVPSKTINVLIARGGEGHLPFGVLEVDSADSGQFDSADADFLASFAGLLGIAISRSSFHRANHESAAG